MPPAKLSSIGGWQTWLLPKLKGYFPWQVAHLGTATIAPGTAQGTDREPSSARSAFDCTGGVESACTRLCVRGRCEPRTARGPAAVSRCTPWRLALGISLELGDWLLEL